MVTERYVYDQITVLEDGQIQLRLARILLDGETELSRLYHREVLAPGQDVTGYPQNVQDICAAAWTPEIIAAYEAAKKAREEAALNP